jgi:hypothetical protein
MPREPRTDMILDFAKDHYRKGGAKNYNPILEATWGLVSF